MEDMQMKNVLKYMILAGVMAFALTSCEKFLDRPSESSYTTLQYYKNDSQVEAGVNFLYNSPWYDIIRFYIYGSETMCGNVYQGANAYTTLTVNGTDADLKNMAYSLWAVNGQANTVIDNILTYATSDVTQATKDRCIGEALAWKAMAYFMLVRTFGDVPIVHNNTQVIGSATYNELSKVRKADVYEYVILTLEKAMELLPKNAYIGQKNRIDYYAAEALLAKVYLAKAGVSGELDQEDLKKARDYAKDVIENSGRSLTPVYSDIFRMTPDKYQQTGECLFTWHWTATKEYWTAQNSIQCDIGMTGFSETGNLWGGWKGPSVDLLEDFGVSPADDPTTRVDTDDRRKATCMMFGDFYPYFWTDLGGFDMYRFAYDPSYYASGFESTAAEGQWMCNSGAQYVKHLYGDCYDHEQAFGYKPWGMYNALPTQVFRLGDLYLIYAEACLLTGDDATAKEYVNKVRARANAAPLSTVDFKAVWRERRLELAMEGDRWYDYVRRSYYDAQACCDEILKQHRSYYDGLNAAYKAFVVDETTGEYVGPGNAKPWDNSGIVYNPMEEIKTVTEDMFVMPFPTEDVVMNPNVGSAAEVISVDVRNTYSYDF